MAVLRRSLTLVTLGILVGCGGSPPAETSKAPTEAHDENIPPAVAGARAFIESLARHAWDEAALSLDASLTKQGGATPKTLETFWTTLEKDAAMSGIESAAVARRGDLDVVLFVCRFGDKRRLVRVSMTSSARVAGLFEGSPTELASPDARAFVELLAARDVTGAHAMLAPALKQQVSEKDLAGLWSELERELGAFGSIDAVDVTETPAEKRAPVRAAVRVTFAKGAREVVVAFGDAAQIVGVKVDAATTRWQPPPYAKTSEFVESTIVVGTADLRALLAKPNAASSGTTTVPGVVLMHRDGPQDEDEKLGELRPFKDLAWGLASRGIAVLRYKKLAIGDLPGDATERDEVILPAVAAVEKLKAIPGVDPARVVVVGHGRGGALAPIVARQAKLPGAAMLAASTRPLADGVLDQLDYLATLDPGNADIKAQIDGWKKVKKRVEEPNLDRSAKIALPSGGTLSGAYFLTAKELAPVQTAATFPGALFIAQGGRDFQVPPAQLAEWQKALAKAPKATFKTYPTLGHLFTPSVGAGKPTPADYDGAAHVDERLVDDLAAWIRKL